MGVLDRLARIRWSQIIDPPSIGTGSVTSVAQSVPSILTVSGSPVTTSGTLALDLATQAANRIFAGPASGADAKPTFRALDAADLDKHGIVTMLLFTTAVHNPIDATAYYFGQPGFAITTTADTRRVYIPRSGTIIGAQVQAYASTAAGDNTSWPMAIRLNNTTDISIASVSASTTYRVWTNTGLSQAVTGGTDYIEIKTVCPTWPTTNPQGVSYYAVVSIAV